jgi:hypothetical protein
LEPYYQNGDQASLFYKFRLDERMSASTGVTNTSMRLSRWSFGMRRVNQLSAISSRARGPRRIRPELWVEPPIAKFFLTGSVGRAPAHVSGGAS